jgi:large subunit ribosomal protein L21
VSALEIGFLERKVSAVFAVFQTGGKQHRVRENDLIEVEKLPAEKGKTIAFSTVLMVGGQGAPKVGAPYVDGASVTAEVVEQTREEKVVVFKKKRRHNYRRKKGHRQRHTVLRIKAIRTE